MVLKPNALSAQPIPGHCRHRGPVSRLQWASKNTIGTGRFPASPPSLSLDIKPPPLPPPPPPPRESQNYQRFPLLRGITALLVSVCLPVHSASFVSALNVKSDASHEQWLREHSLLLFIIPPPPHPNSRADPHPIPPPRQFKMFRPDWRFYNPPSWLSVKHQVTYSTIHELPRWWLNLN